MRLITLLIVLLLLTCFVTTKRSKGRSRGSSSSSSSFWTRKTKVETKSSSTQTETKLPPKPSAPKEPQIKKENANLQQNSRPIGWDVNNNQQVPKQVNPSHSASGMHTPKPPLYGTASYPTNHGSYGTGSYPTNHGSYGTGAYPGYHGSYGTGSYPGNHGSYGTGSYPTNHGLYAGGAYPTNQGSFGTGSYPTNHGSYGAGMYPTNYGSYGAGSYPTNHGSGMYPGGYGYAQPNQGFMGGYQQKPGLLGSIFGGQNKYGHFGGYPGYGMKKSGGFFGKHAFRNVLGGIFVWYMISGLIKTPFKVYNYYNRPMEVQEMNLPSNVLMLCNENATNICVPGTTAICTQDNQILCVSSMSQAVPCKEDLCVNSTIPCVDADDPLCQNKSTNSTTTISLPCLTKMNLEKSETVPSNLTLPVADSNQYCVTAMAVPDPTITESTTIVGNVTEVPPIS